MDKKTKLVAHQRYTIRYTLDGYRFQTIMGKQSRVVFNSLKDARAYLHKVIDNVPNIMGVCVRPEVYYVDKKADS